MPIVLAAYKPTLVEVGRIRLGHKVNGKRPEKLEKFRITSPHRTILEGASALYGGDVREWHDKMANPSSQHELYSESNVLRILYIVGECDTFLERWNAGGCDIRTDGEFYYDGFEKTTRRWDGPTDKDGLEAMGVKPVTRLAVMLEGVPSLGTFRLESHGYYASKELMGITRLVEMLATTKMVPGELVLENRKSTRNGRTNRFQVPTLNFPIIPEELVQAERAAIEQAFNDQVAFESANVPKGLTAGVGMSDEDIFAEYEGESRPTPAVRDTSLPRTEGRQPVVANSRMATADQLIEVEALAGHLGMTEDQLLKALKAEFPKGGILKVEHLQAKQADVVIEKMRAAVVKRAEAAGVDPATGEVDMPITTNDYDTETVHAELVEDDQ